MFGWGKKRREHSATVKRDPEPPPQETPSYGIPTIKFDPAKVTDAVKTDLRRNIENLADVDASYFDMVYDAALRCISVGGDRHVLFKALMTIDGMGKRRASDIANSLESKATALMNAEGQQKLGIEYATWVYSGAPCAPNPKDPTSAELERDAAHKAANGKPYFVAKGMFLNGRWTWPGREDSCKCTSRSMILGFDGYNGGKPEGFVE
jgi:hypothetical protein